MIVPACQIDDYMRKMLEQIAGCEVANRPGKCIIAILIDTTARVGAVAKLKHKDF